jgi:hypothetical protein
VGKRRKKKSKTEGQNENEQGESNLSLAQGYPQHHGEKSLLKVTNFLQLTINWYIVILFATLKAKIKHD